MTLALPRLSPGNCGDLIVPSLANSQNLAFGGSWGSPAYTQINAGLAVPFILMGLSVCMRLNLAAGSQNSLVQVLIGIGTAGFETPVAGVAVTNLGVAANTASSGGFYRVAPVLIPASTRIAGQASMDDASGVVLAVYLAGVQADTWEQALRLYGELDRARYCRGLLAKPGGSYFAPVKGTKTLTTGGSSWTMGAWVEFIASTVNPLWVTGACIDQNNDSSERVQMELGIGADGQEQVVGRCAFAGTGHFQQRRHRRVPAPRVLPARLARQRAHRQPHQRQSEPGVPGP